MLDKAAHFYQEPLHEEIRITEEYCSLSSKPNVDEHNEKDAE
jgi:hypothetical protein